VVSTSEDISPTCPCEDPTLGTIVATAVAYTALIDQHIVPSEGMDDRMPDLLPWEGLLPVRHLGQPMDVALLLSSECLPSTVSCMFPTFEETWTLVSWSVLRNVRLTCVLIQKEVKSWLGPEFPMLRASLV
jgi:hypothetical protein